MSHFTVLVFGENIKEQMEPFQEEPTKPEYLKFVNCTHEVIKEWVEDKENFLKYGETQYENIVEAIEDYYEYHTEVACFERWFPKEKNIREKFMEASKTDPIELTKKAEEIYKQYEGLDIPEDITIDGYSVGYLTNPNSFWDWYKIGGRWAGFFKLKEGATGIQGEAGLFGTGRNLGDPTYADQAKFKDIDFDGMFEENKQKAKERYEQFEKTYNNSEKKENGTPIDFNPYFDYNIESIDRDTYIPESKEDHINRSTLHIYGCMYKGKYYSKGDMGWFGMSSNEKESTKWIDQFKAILDKQDPETTVTLLDCHV